MHVCRRQGLHLNLAAVDEFGAVRALRQESFGGGEADATRAARDERHSSFELSVHARVLNPECASRLGAERVLINRLLTIS